MRTHRAADDRAVEDLLAGRIPVDEPMASLAEAVTAVRRLGEGPVPEPRGALATILRDGLPPELVGGKADSPAMAGSSASRPARALAGPPKLSKVSSMLAPLFAWIAGLSTVAKAATAVAATSAVVAGGAIAGVPAAVSDAFDRGQAEDPLPAVEDIDADEDEERGRPDEPGADGLDEAEGRSAHGGSNGADAAEHGSDNALPGLQRAREETADTPANIPEDPGPGAGEAQRAPEAGAQTGEARSEQAPAGPETGEEQRQGAAPAGPERGEEQRQGAAPAGPERGEEQREDEVPADADTGGQRAADAPADGPAPGERGPRP